MQHATGSCAVRPAKGFVADQLCGVILTLHACADAYLGYVPADAAPRSARPSIHDDIPTLLTARSPVLVNLDHVSCLGLIPASELPAELAHACIMLRSCRRLDLNACTCIASSWLLWGQALLSKRQLLVAFRRSTRTPCVTAPAALLLMVTCGSPAALLHRALANAPPLRPAWCAAADSCAPCM